MQQARSELLFYESPTVTVWAATGRGDGRGVEGRERKGHLLFPDPLGQPQGLLVCGDATDFKHVNKDFDCF